MANALWALLFVYAAAVQLNDPDPVPWVTMYGLAALFCGLAVAGRAKARPALGYAALTGTFAAITLVRSGEGSADMGGFPQFGVLKQELVREGLGLCLVSAWMAVLGGWTMYMQRQPEG